MKKINLIIFYFAISLSFFAQLQKSQQAHITWGDELKFKKGEEFIKYLGKDSRNHFLIKSLKRGSQYEINIFGNDMGLKNKAVIDMKHHGNYRMTYEGSYLINNNIYVFSSFPDKKNKINRLYCRTFDKNDLSIGKLTEIEQLPYEKGKFKGSFGVEVSDDESMLLVYLGKPYEKNAPEKFGFTVLDEKLNEKWKKDIELPYTEQFFKIQDYQINNDGDVYLLGKEYKERKKDRIKGAPNYKYHILAYLDNGRKIKDYEINLEDKFITDITYKIAKNGDLICSGLYSKNGTTSIKGAFYMTIDFDTRKIKNNSIREFEEDFITQGWSDKEIAKAKKKELKKDKAIEMYQYDLSDFILKEDGGAILLAEQFYITVSTYTTTDANGNTTTRTVYHYHYNDVILVNISPKGKIEWVTKVEKSQHSTNDGGYLSSYVLQVDGDQLHLIYNESARNYFEKEERKGMKRKDKNAYLTVIATVESNGEYQKEILINASEENTYPVPKFSEQINDKQLLIYTRRKKSRKFALVDFK